MRIQLLASLALLTTTTACAARSATVTDAPAAAAETGDTADTETARATDTDTATTGTADNAEVAVRFGDRTVDLRPFVQGYPYSGFEIDAERDRMLWFETTPEGVWLRTARPSEHTQLDPATGAPLGLQDWSLRSWWGAQWLTTRPELLAWADDANEERMNLFAIDATSGEIRRLTDEDYTYGMGLSDDEHTLFWIARSGTEGNYTSCLRSMPLDGARPAATYVCDTDSRHSFTWTGIELDPEGTRAIVNVMTDGDRNRGNLALLDMRLGRVQQDILLPEGVERYGVYAVHRSWQNNSLLYVSAETGFDNLYRLDLSTRTSVALTELTDEISSLVYAPGPAPLVWFTLKRPHETVLRAINPSDGALVHEATLDAQARLVDAWEGEGYLSLTSTTAPLAIERFVWGELDGGFLFGSVPFVAMPEALQEQLVQCRSTRVSFPTFDTLADGSPRMLHAFYLEPQNPPADPADRLVFITAFYGGDNTYSTRAQILCEAGIATLSPAVRGSWGFGADFAALNDGDLGGDEIVDLFWAARWLESTHGYTPQQIGVSGGSHGGYATMRAMTFPSETNGHNDRYDFGFGWSHAGFSDILAFWRTCNIPDWVVLEAGDPEVDAERIADRSPIAHVELLNAPLLLTHGSADQRVPVEGSRAFAARAAELGRPVTYVEFDGQGHGIDGLANVVRYYRAAFDFLNAVAGR